MRDVEHPPNPRADLTVWLWLRMQDQTGLGMLSPTTTIPGDVQKTCR